MDKLLPIGTVVKVKKIEKPAMIHGYMQTMGNENIVKDYIGLPYPEGNINMFVQLGFNDEDIEKVIFEGYRSCEFEEIEKKALEYKKQN